MRKFLILLIASSLALSACGMGARRAQKEAAIAEAGGNPLMPSERRGLLSKPEAVDTSVLIGNVTELQVEQTLSGAIIHATGVADRQGAFSSALVADDPDLAAQDGVLSLSFRVNYPSDPTPIGSTAQRTIHEAVSLSAQTLRNVRVIEVRGAQNAVRTSRR